MQVAESGVRPEVCPKIGRNRVRVPSQEDSEKYQAEQRRDLRSGEDILDEGAGLDAKNIDDREDDHYQDRNQVLRVQPNVHAAEHHGADRKLRHLPQVDDPMTGRDRRPEDSEKLAERHAHGWNRARLNYEEQSPDGEETLKRAERFA